MGKCLSYIYFINNIRKFFDIYTSTNDDSINATVITREKSVCLNISNLMFSLLLSSIIELCSLIPLTAKANMHGINIMLCSKSSAIKNSSPFPNSKAKYYRRNGIA